MSQRLHLQISDEVWVFFIFLNLRGREILICRYREVCIILPSKLQQNSYVQMQEIIYSQGCYEEVSAEF